MRELTSVDQRSPRAGFTCGEKAAAVQVAVAVVVVGGGGAAAAAAVVVMRKGGNRGRGWASAFRSATAAINARLLRSSPRVAACWAHQMQTRACKQAAMQTDIHRHVDRPTDRPTDRHTDRHTPPPPPPPSPPTKHPALTTTKRATAARATARNNTHESHPRRERVQRVVLLAVRHASTQWPRRAHERAGACPLLLFEECRHLVHCDHGDAVPPRDLVHQCGEAAEPPRPLEHALAGVGHLTTAYASDGVDDHELDAAGAHQNGQVFPDERPKLLRLQQLGDEDAVQQPLAGRCRAAEDCGVLLVEVRRHLHEPLAREPALRADVQAARSRRATRCRVCQPAGGNWEQALQRELHAELALARARLPAHVGDAARQDAATEARVDARAPSGQLAGSRHGRATLHNVPRCGGRTRTRGERGVSDSPSAAAACAKAAVARHRHSKVASSRIGATSEIKHFAL
jgi:hypothetical protein